MKKNKVVSVIGTVLTTVILLFTVVVMVFTIVSVNTVGRESAGILGYRPYIVLSDSMRAQFAVGDIVVSKNVQNGESLQPGDIITFTSIDPANSGAVVTHKIRSVTEYKGEKAYVTYGTTTGSDDEYPVPASKVMGVYSFTLPRMGYFFEFLKTPMGYVVVILVPFLLILLMNGIRFFKLVKQYKREKQEELDKEKQELVAERERNEAMLQELQALKAQMAAGTQQDDREVKKN
ncbi:MAG: signal peptidase I [Oscillospiraceae bacterium]|jgi:signal peptidase I|nr:signal peptidase I [Oscillospiraceae bacterium]